MSPYLPYSPIVGRYLDDQASTRRPFLFQAAKPKSATHNQKRTWLLTRFKVDRSIPFSLLIILIATYKWLSKHGRPSIDVDTYLGASKRSNIDSRKPSFSKGFHCCLYHPTRQVCGLYR